MWPRHITSPEIVSTARFSVLILLTIISPRLVFNLQNSDSRKSDTSMEASPVVMMSKQWTIGASTVIFVLWWSNYQWKRTDATFPEWGKNSFQKVNLGVCFDINLQSFPWLLCVHLEIWFWQSTRTHDPEKRLIEVWIVQGPCWFYLEIIQIDEQALICQEMIIIMDHVFQPAHQKAHWRRQTLRRMELWNVLRPVASLVHDFASQNEDWLLKNHPFSKHSRCELKEVGRQV